MNDWQKLPVLRNDRLIFEDTSGPPKAHAIVPCLLCTKPFLMLPFIGVPDQICPECEKTYKDTAKVICNGGIAGRQSHAPVTICRLKPRQLDNGFIIRPRSVLHSSACNVCKPGLAESTLVEVDEWQRIQGKHKIIIPGK